jgi:hypothetical protein
LLLLLLPQSSEDGTDFFSRTGEELLQQPACNSHALRSHHPYSNMTFKVGPTSIR